MITYLIAFAVAIILSLVFTYLVREWAMRHGLVDRPDTYRKFHKIPIPRLGGLAIYLSLIWSLIAVYFLPSLAGTKLRENPAEVGVLVALGGLMLAVGIWDDLKGISPWTKLVAQIMIALASWALGFRILEVWNGNGTIFYMGILSLPITVIWIVGITNAFNLIDGIDGLSSGAALLAMLPLAVASILSDQPLSLVILASLAGATLGFLRYNFNPASIFLGDSGSLMLGFMLSLIAVKYSQKSATAVAIAVPIVAFGFPILDMAMVMIRRLLIGKPVFWGDRKHIHHVLLELGLNSRRALTILYGVCGLFGLFSLLFMNPSGRVSGIALAILGACIWFGIRRLHYPELREFRSFILRSIQRWRKLLTGNVNVGIMLEGLRSAAKLSDVLESLSLLLKEMDFEVVEVRLPRMRKSLPVYSVRDWTVTRQGRNHYLYRWAASPLKASMSEAENAPSQLWNLRNPENVFKIEYAFEVARAPYLSEDTKAALRAAGNDAHIAHLTLYHPTENGFSVSAICLLSRNVWKEFAAAVCRVMTQPHTLQMVDRDADESVETAETFYPSVPPAITA